MNKKSVQSAKKAGFSQKNSKQNNSLFFPVKKTILGIGVTDASEERILESIVNFVEKSSENAYIVTPNPEMIVESARNFSFKNALNRADLALCDGSGLLVAGQLVGKPLTSRIIGTNFVERLCEKVSDRPITVGFLGGKPGVAVRVAERLKKKYPKLLVGFAGEEWHEGGPVSSQLPASARTSEPSVQVLRPGGNPSGAATPQSSSKKLDILFVAFGAPKQELWMAEHLNNIPVRVMMGVGGAFDQIVDPSLRAPHYINSMGMGWLYRLIRQPWRIKRQAALLTFLLLVGKELVVGQKEKR